MSIKQIVRPEGDASIDYCAPERSNLYANLGEEEIEALDRIAHPVTVSAQSALLRQHTPARHVYNLMSGALMVDRLSAGGRRQVLAFLFPGDFLGIAHNEYFEFTVHALTDATVAAYHRKEFGQLTDKYPTLKHNMDAISSNVLARALDQVFALGQKKAHERVCFLLNQILQRQPGSTPEKLMLPMTRRDIADYLGLTIETVSRAFSKLHDDGVLEIDQIYECHILDLPALQEMAASD